MFLFIYSGRRWAQLPGDSHDSLIYWVSIFNVSSSVSAASRFVTLQLFNYFIISRISVRHLCLRSFYKNLIHFLSEISVWLFVFPPSSCLMHTAVNRSGLFKSISKLPLCKTGYF